MSIEIDMACVSWILLMKSANAEISWAKKVPECAPANLQLHAVTEEDKAWTEDASDDETGRERKLAQAAITQLNKAQELDQVPNKIVKCPHALALILFSLQLPCLFRLRYLAKCIEAAYTTSGL